jgi:hypothetical protein
VLEWNGTAWMYTPKHAEYDQGTVPR